MLAGSRQAITKKIPAQALHLTVDELLEVYLLQGDHLRIFEQLVCHQVAEHDSPDYDRSVFGGRGYEVEGAAGDRRPGDVIDHTQVLLQSTVELADHL